jgi:hypothetical protein
VAGVGCGKPPAAITDLSLAAAADRTTLTHHCRGVSPMDTSLLDLMPGLAASARVVGELPAGPADFDAPAQADDSPDVNGAGDEAADRDCKPD